MKKLPLLLAVVALGFAISNLWSHKTLADREVAFARQQSAWQSEKSELENALSQRKTNVITLPGESRTIEVQKSISPSEIIARLQTMKPGVNQSRPTRLLTHQFETLVDLGSDALPAIREYLMRNQEIEYDANFSRRFRDGKVPLDFAVPPSLRLGLLESVKNIGGAGAEQLLADVLGSSGRGVEIAYVANALQELAPDKYRDIALAAAHELLAKPLATDASSAIDRFDRSFLLGVLTMFNDASYATEAQAQLILPDGKVDSVSLRYLQQTMGDESLAVVSRVWDDPRIAADQKEPLARVALAYVGANSDAEQLYQKAINDSRIPDESRKNLIEDLNESGFPNPRQLRQSDLALIQKRIALIERLGPNAMDQINAAAFKEAYKDLVNMRNSLLAKSNPVP